MIRSVRSIPQLRRPLHSSSSAPNPSHLLSTQQSSIRTHYNSLTVQKLRNECKGRGLKINGRKHELVDRIVGFEHVKLFSSTPKVNQPKPETVKVPTSKVEEKVVEDKAPRTSPKENNKENELESIELPAKDRTFLYSFAAAVAGWFYIGRKKKEEDN